MKVILTSVKMVRVGKAVCYRMKTAVQPTQYVLVFVKTLHFELRFGLLFYI